MLDLAAPGARQVALEERLELQHQREFIFAVDALVEQIFADGHFLLPGDAHIA
jgi:hypothetical protein